MAESMENHLKDLGSERGNYRPSGHSQVVVECFKDRKSTLTAP